MIYLTFKSQDGLDAGHVEATGNPVFPYGLVFTKQSTQHKPVELCRSMRVVMFHLHSRAGKDAVVKVAGGNNVS